jgi:AcrR family transcriptional regulator
MPEARPERADAARNRRAILAATEELLTRLPPAQISMEQVAAAAGVGKGTVFHRFGNRAGLMRALMQERAMALQQALVDGPPPLGPGAPARERLLAFLDAVVEVIARNTGLLAALDHAEAVVRAPVQDPPPLRTLWHAHLAGLLHQARPDLDADLLADLLMSCLHSDAVKRPPTDGSTERVAAALRILVSGLLTG